MDIDTRLLRYFEAVAREGNLTAAAGRLYVSQPALTKQIRRLEDRLQVRLFNRSKSGMALTAAGQSLAERVPGLLADWDAVLRQTRVVAGHANRVLRIGFLASAANEATPDIIAAFQRLRPDWRVDMRQASWADPTAGLPDGDVDVALLRLPVPDQERLRLRVLLTEPRCVVLPATHGLADRDTIHIDELRDESFVGAPAATGRWRDYWLGIDGDAPDEDRVIGAVAEQPDEWLSAIANGHGIALAPESAQRFYSRPGIVHVPVTGVGPSRVAVAWIPARDADPVVADFVRCCRDVCGDDGNREPDRRV